MFSQFFSRQFAVFFIISIFAAAVNFFTRIIVNKWTDFSNAVLVAYLVAMFFAFFMGKKIVFKNSTQPLTRSVLFFTLINLLGIIQAWAVSTFLYKYLTNLGLVELYRAEISHIIGIATPVFSSFLGHKFISFRSDL